MVGCISTCTYIGESEPTLPQEPDIRQPCTCPFDDTRTRMLPSWRAEGNRNEPSMYRSSMSNTSALSLDQGSPHISSPSHTPLVGGGEESWPALPGCMRGVRAGKGERGEPSEGTRRGSPPRTGGLHRGGPSFVFFLHPQEQGIHVEMSREQARPPWPWAAARVPGRRAAFARVLLVAGSSAD